ncbi:TMAO reductase system periplasmic protein TorT [Malikia sp.]|uniref:TMAO reductase system periplasmic protein TorT n=1 Tax=Malikia sp. TaxID=2070706 RepID=UPI00260D26F0|nr:TMAO reductase system periplasmic protein TorT [Malikia sp.]MDD2729289.1 TMAO reductase system periplasmic protein TorT [Malikia sp.]
MKSPQRPCTSSRRTFSGLLALALLAPLAPVPASAQMVMSWEPPFTATQPKRVEHVPTAAASKPWVLCVVIPHIKDAYWLGINYGMVDEARRLRVEVRFAEAGGYSQLELQRSQIQACAADRSVDALIVGAVSRNVMTPQLRRLTARMPVIGTVNAIADEGISGKVGVDWDEMGRAAGAFLAAQAQGDGPPIPIAWFPGPRSVSEGVDRAFRQAIAGSRLVIRTTAWGDTGKAVQRNLLQQVLDEHPDLRFVAGNALMTEAAISVLRERGLQERIGVVSTYFTPAVQRGIMRGRILAAPTDAPVLQGRLSVGMAVDLLEQRPTRRHLGPVVRTVDRSNLEQIEIGDSLSPPLQMPQIHYRPQERD